jgi:hypothetical protein
LSAGGSSTSLEPPPSEPEGSAPATLRQGGPSAKVFTMAEIASHKNAGVLAIVLALVMTLPVLSMIFDGFDYHRMWLGCFGLGLYAVMLCFYLVTAQLVIAHPE